MQNWRLDQAVFAYGQGPLIWSALVYGTPSLVDASGVVESLVRRVIRGEQHS